MIAEVCRRVVVMYAGRTVEEGDVMSIFDDPLHPYTRALLAAVPSRAQRGVVLAAIPGRVPSLLSLPVGCKFADRCNHARDVCREREPSFLPRGERRVRCFIYDDDVARRPNRRVHDSVARDAGAGRRTPAEGTSCSRCATCARTFATAAASSRG